MSEWQPIESAPKDETDILLFFPDGYWSTGSEYAVGFWGSVGEPDAGWYHGEADSTSMTAFGSHPSHWAPLPLPPKDIQEGTR